MIPFANHLWQSTLFAAGAGLLTLLLRANSAHVRYCVWLAASVKFLIPFSLLVAAGGLVGSHTTTAIAPARSVIVRVGAPFAAVPVPRVAAPTVERSGVSIAPAVLLAVWMMGAATLICRWFLRWRRMRGWVHRSAPLDLPAGLPVRTSSAFREPGVFGILRPVLLLPEGIVDSLTAQELRAIVAHELCHVRRRDNLAAALHMLVETVFWFHPLVWWLGARLLDERERACDEEVLRAGIEPRVYAEGILRICELYLASPHAGVAGVTGGDLKKRIETIMSDRVAVALSRARKIALTVAGLAALAVPVTVGVLRAPVALAQTPDLAAPDGPEFDVASIKPLGQSRPMNGIDLNVLRGFQMSRPGLFHIFDATLGLLIQLAYEIDDVHLAGGPAWVNSDRYQVIAKTGPHTAPEQMRPMVKSLLRDRFKLELRREMRNSPVYLLTAAKGGVKIKDAPEGGCVKFDPEKPPPPFNPNRPPPPVTGCGDTRIQILGAPSERITRIDAVAVSMPKLVEIISREAGRVVIDNTGFTGKFDFRLEFAAAQLSEPGAGVPIAAALRQQLGLRLQPARRQVEVLVIDRVERPSAN